MLISLNIIKEGIAFRVYALEFGDSYDASSFLLELEKTDCHEYVRMVRRLDYLADHGVIFDERKYRNVGDGIFEAKTRKGSRVLFFYEKDRIILCTSAFIKKKPKTPPDQLQRAKERRQAFWRARKDGLIKF